MSKLKVTDKDREASDALHVKQCPHGGRDACLCRECRAEAIAQAREEEREACERLRIAVGNGKPHSDWVSACEVLVDALAAHAGRRNAENAALSPSADGSKEAR
mgnify:CR=1 FL=1